MRAERSDAIASWQLSMALTDDDVSDSSFACTGSFRAVEIMPTRVTDSRIAGILKEESLQHGLIPFLA